MKSISVYAFVAAAACSAFLISSANAGGHHHGVGLSNSATTSTSATATGRSPLGEAVFLIPSTTTGATVVGRERVSPAREQMHLLEKPAITSGSDRGTKVIFTPPPTIVGVPPSVTGTGNIAGNNLADGTFGSSILNSGLESKNSHPSLNVQRGSNGQSDPRDWIRITPLQYNKPTAPPTPPGH
jgi:hypothetical protein